MDSAVSQSEANHLHVMNKSQNQVVLPLAPPPPLEQCETGAPERFFHPNRLTGQLFLLLTNTKLMKKRCNDTFNAGRCRAFGSCYALPLILFCESGLQAGAHLWLLLG